MSIKKFTEEYEFLDNNFMETFVFDGITYNNVEAAFQAQKTDDKEIREAFGHLPGHIAKKMGRKLTLPINWNDGKEEIMYQILLAKFCQNEWLAKELLNTGNQQIEYTIGDDFWGVDNYGIGRNTLGKLLMKVRDNLKDGINDDALENDFLFKRLRDAYYEHDRLIIAYDIDDTVRPYKSTSCEKVRILIRRAKKLLNPYFIVFTANPHYEKNVSFLKRAELPYDSINQNADFIGRYGEGLKVYYNLLLDDKAGLKESYDALKRLCDEVEEADEDEFFLFL